jgi:hypothetical protein
MAKKHHKYSHSHIEHHKDGSHTVHHVHEDGQQHDVKHAVGGLDELHDSMQDHLGMANPGEAVANAGPSTPGAAAPAVPAPGV